MTLADLQKALAVKSPEEQARARQQQEKQRGMAEMEGRIMSGAQHVLVFHDQAVQAQALAKIPVEDIKKKAADAPGELGPRDAVARHLLRSPCVHVNVDVFVRRCMCVCVARLVSALSAASAAQAPPASTDLLQPHALPPALCPAVCLVAGETCLVRV